MRIPETYIVIDIETTGLPEQDKRGNKNFSDVQIIEIGALKCNSWERYGGRRQDDSMKFSILVAPWTKEDEEQGEGYMVLPEKITQLTGITESILEKEAVFPEEAARKLMDFLGYDPNESGTWTQRPTDGDDPRLIVVGHNILGFDLPILRRIVDLPVSEVYDTMLLWRAWCLGMRKGEWESLDHFYGRVGAERFSGQSNLEFCLRTLCGPTGLVDAGYVHGHKHRAPTDCIAAHIVFETMRTRGILKTVFGEENA